MTSVTNMRTHAAFHKAL